jgi:hypothetical protein
VTSAGCVPLTYQAAALHCATPSHPECSLCAVVRFSILRRRHELFALDLLISAIIPVRNLPGRNWPLG